MAIRRTKPKPRSNGPLFTKGKAKRDKQPPILELKNIYKTYEGAVPVKALRGVSLTMERGEMVAIMGASGSGKTTLLNIASLIDTHDQGSVKFDGKPVEDLKRRQLITFRQEEIGLVFQQKNLIPTLTAIENVFLPFRYKRGKRRIQQEQAMEALRLVGLTERANHLPSKLSGGEQQRVAIARALVLSPAIVLADEPTGELDSKTGQQIVDLMLDLNHQTGQSFLIVTHNEAVAKQCDRTVYMRDGQVLEIKKHRRRKR
jgi:putative ABC transport system ATP-binding protein